MQGDYRDSIAHLMAIGSARHAAATGSVMISPNMSNHSQTLIYIMMTYNTLFQIQYQRHSPILVNTGRGGTYLTAGASADKVTVPNPAARTAVACSNPSMKRTPRGMVSMAWLPMSRTRKKNQSVALQKRKQSPKLTDQYVLATHETDETGRRTLKIVVL